MGREAGWEGLVVLTAVAMIYVGQKKAVFSWLAVVAGSGCVCSEGDVFV